MRWSPKLTSSAWTPSNRRTSPRRSDSGFLREVQDRSRESRAAVRRVVEEQGRLDQLELHDPECPFVIRNDIDARVSRLDWRGGKRVLGELYGADRRRLTRQGHAAEIFLHAKVARFWS